MPRNTPNKQQAVITTSTLKYLTFAATAALHAIVFCHAQAAPVLADWDDVTAITEAYVESTQLTTPLYPPANLKFTLKVGEFAIDENDFGFLTANIAPELRHDVPVWLKKYKENMK